jgi:hypothetical protein
MRTLKWVFFLVFVCIYSAPRLIFWLKYLINKECIEGESELDKYRFASKE